MYRTFFFCLFVCRLIGVFGYPYEVKTVSVSVYEGESVTLHKGYINKQDFYSIEWKFGTEETLIAEYYIDSSSISISDTFLDGRYTDRLQVNDQNGALTITNITTHHSGLYQMITTTSSRLSDGIELTSYGFNVTVYAHLPIPIISRNSSQSSKCVLLCSVLNATHVTLSWYKEKSLLSSISVSDLYPSLSLPLEVEYQDNNTYTCVVNNPISNLTQHLNIGHVCQSGSECVNFCNTTEAVIRLVVSALVGVAIVAVLFYEIRSKRAEQEKKS
ncbi:CD48 antigen-like [Paramisgurnus dabryanus]|uniref:CD48 antigen-like n=1 Tax=Paramisgurnus dabryanus TaxID=90735 RepID=UPI0031F3B770